MAALVDSLKTLEMDSSVRSLRSQASVASENFFSTNDWDPKPSPAKKTAAPKATLRVLGRESINVNMAMAELLNSHGCVVEHSEQHRDREVGVYFQRAEFDWSAMRCSQESLQRALDEVCGRLELEYQLEWGTRPKRLCIFVSKYDHVLWEILLRHKAGELPCDIPLIISNHADLQPIADAFGVRFEVFKVTKATKPEVEAAEMKLMEELEIDLVVRACADQFFGSIHTPSTRRRSHAIEATLDDSRGRPPRHQRDSPQVLARYMQIITDEFCAAYPHRVINIHHSFLPAFIGSKPYHRAHARGVKLVGATAHYATADLDEGPIIEQDCARISHKNSIDDLLRKGRVLEKNVLVTAVRAHVEDRIIVYESKCVVFGE